MNTNPINIECVGGDRDGYQTVIGYGFSTIAFHKLNLHPRKQPADLSTSLIYRSTGKFTKDGRIIFVPE